MNLRGKTMDKKRILIVDDEPDFTHMIKLNLEETGNYEVHTENQGNKALETARQFKPDMIFLDIIMPDMDGPQLLAILRKDARLKYIPVVFLTALVTKDEITEEGSVIAGNAFLAKPVTTERLIASIKENIG